MTKALNLFTSKSVQAIDGELWPEYSSEEGGLQLLRRSIPFINYMFFSDTPYWQTLNGLRSLIDWFHLNPVFYAVVMIKAREYSNMRIKVVNRSSGLEEPVITRKDIPRKLYALFNKPNVMQSRWEFLQQRKIFEEVCGNSFTYGNFGLGMQRNFSNIVAMWNVWPSYMNFKLGGNYFEATKIEEVVKEWKFEFGNYKKTWEPNEIMHKNKPNTNVTDGLIFGRSPAQSLIRPLTNIDMAYEARNVLMKNRGMRTIISSNKNDASGSVALQQHEIDEVELAMRKFGLLENQRQFFFTAQPVNVTAIDQDVRKLGLFEEIATDAMMVCNAYGVPEVLLKLYLQGATFENQEASVRRLYQGTLIPEAEDEMIAFNTFLGLPDTDWMLVPSFDHVASLQTDKKTEQERIEKEKRVAMDEFSKGLITLEEYRERMGYGPMPKQENTEEDGNKEPEEDEQEDN